MCSIAHIPYVQLPSALLVVIIDGGCDNVLVGFGGRLGFGTDGDLVKLDNGVNFGFGAITGFSRTDGDLST